MVKAAKRNKLDKTSDQPLEDIISQLSDDSLPVIHRLVLGKLLTEDKSIHERLLTHPQLNATFVAKMDALKRESRLKGLTGFN